MEVSNVLESDLTFLGHSIGGFDLALGRLGCETVAYSEIDPWAWGVMEARFPGAANLGDITKIDWREFDRPDILCGGFPCQDISVAGKGAGLAGARSGLWYEFARAIRELRPRLVLVENVGALLVRGIDAVLGTLAEIGYDAEWQVLSAAAVGAPHRRERVWIVAHREGVGLQGFGAGGLTEPPAYARQGLPVCGGPLADRDGRGQRGQRGQRGNVPEVLDAQPRRDADGCCSAARWPTPRTEDGESTGISAERRARGIADNLPSAIAGKLNPDWVETLMGFPVGWTDPAIPNEQLVWTPFPAGPGPQFDWEPPRVTTRKDGRRKRLRCLGNAIVPACLEAILTGGGVW